MSDAGVGALCARSAIMGAFLNVRINVTGLTDQDAASAYLEQGRAIQEKAIAAETTILTIVDSRI